jgi:hypothetical protein
MPEVRGDRLEVSAEEERYLRRAFRRFALPWLILAGALGALIGALPRWIEANPEPTVAAEPPQAREPNGELRGDIAAVSQRVVGAESAVANLRDRVALLESQSGGSGSGARGSDAIDQRFDAFASRIAALESRLGAEDGSAPAEALHLEKQLDSLDARLARLEAAQAGPRPDAPADLER